MLPPQSSRRLLQSGSDSSVPNPNSIPPADPPSGINSDVVVILVVQLCALICVISLAAVARCARSRRNRAAAAEGGGLSSPTSSAADAEHFGGGGGNHGASAAGVNVTTTTTMTSKGFKKKALKALPKLAYADAVAAVGAAAGEDEKAEEVLAMGLRCGRCSGGFLKLFRARVGASRFIRGRWKAGWARSVRGLTRASAPRPRTWRHSWTRV